MCQVKLNSIEKFHKHISKGFFPTASTKNVFRLSFNQLYGRLFSKTLNNKKSEYYNNILFKRNHIKLDTRFNFLLNGGSRI